jgi:hypothetical protein
MMMSQGISAGTFAPDKRANRPAFSRGGRRQLVSTALMAAMFRGKYCMRTTLNFSPAMIQEALDSIESKGQRDSKAAITFIRKKWDKTHTLGPIQLLAALQIQLSNDEPKLLVNYFSMHQRVIEILRLIRIKKNSKFAQYFGPTYIQNETQLRALIALIHHVAKMSVKVPSPLTGGTLMNSRMLMSCGEVLVQHLKENGDAACRELREWCTRQDLLLREKEDQDEVSTEWVSWLAVEDVLGPAVIARMQTGISM